MRDLASRLNPLDAPVRSTRGGVSHHSLMVIEKPVIRLVRGKMTEEQIRQVEAWCDTRHYVGFDTDSDAIRIIVHDVNRYAELHGKVTALVNKVRHFLVSDPPIGSRVTLARRDNTPAGGCYSFQGA